MFMSINKSTMVMASKTNDDVPPSPTNDYLDRAAFVAKILNPVNLLASKRTIERAQQATDANSRALVAARVHPDTQKLIPMLFSLPSIIPVNLVIVAGMLAPRQTNSSIAFWQILNQSFNTGVNWANANKSGGEQTAAELLKSYSVSVLASCAMSMGFNKIAVRRQSALLKSMAPLCGVMGANVVNVAVMRGRELRDGIAVKNQDGEQVGVSKKAAQQAIFHTILSRNLIAAALLALPPLTMHGLRPLLTGKGPLTKQLVEGAVILSWMVPSVPLGVALYPQQEHMSVEDLEPELAGELKGSVDKVSFNRGF